VPAPRSDVTFPAMIRSLLALLCCGFALFISPCAKAASDELVVGMELSYPPFEMTDENNQPAGIGVELAHALADALHKKLVIKNTEFTGLIPALKTGKIDLIISSMTANEERAKSIDFSDPYMHTGICLLVGAHSDVQKVEDLNKPGRKVVVKDGTTGFLYARDHLPQAQLLPISEESACVLEVIQGKADAFIYDQMSIYQFHQRNPTTTRAMLTPFQQENWAIGIRKGNDELRKQVNAFLADFKAKHGLEQLGEKYLKADKEAFREMGYPFSS
jgi:polar amino acid transport system substrate-binding protein